MSSHPPAHQPTHLRHAGPDLPRPHHAPVAGGKRVAAGGEEGDGRGGSCLSAAAPPAATCLSCCQPAPARTPGDPLPARQHSACIRAVALSRRAPQPARGRVPVCTSAQRAQQQQQQRWARRRRSPQAARDGVLVDRARQVDVLALVHTLLHVPAHVLGQLAADGTGGRKAKRRRRALWHAAARGLCAWTCCAGAAPQAAPVRGERRRRSGRSPACPGRCRPATPRAPRSGRHLPTASSAAQERTGTAGGTGQPAAGPDQLPAPHCDDPPRLTPPNSSAPEQLAEEVGQQRASQVQALRQRGGWEGGGGRAGELEGPPAAGLPCGGRSSKLQTGPPQPAPASPSPLQPTHLVAVVVAVVLLAPPQRHQQQAVDHVAKEVGLPVGAHAIGVLAWKSRAGNVMQSPLLLPSAARTARTPTPGRAFLVSQNSSMPMCGSSSFCSSSRAYCGAGRGAGREAVPRAGGYQSTWYAACGAAGQAPPAPGAPARTPPCGLRCAAPAHRESRTPVHPAAGHPPTSMRASLVAPRPHPRRPRQPCLPDASPTQPHPPGCASPWWRRSCCRACRCSPGPPPARGWAQARSRRIQQVGSRRGRAGRRHAAGVRPRPAAQRRPPTCDWMGNASSIDGRSASIMAVSPKSYTMCSRMSLSACGTAVVPPSATGQLALCDGPDGGREPKWRAGAGRRVPRPAHPSSVHGTRCRHIHRGRGTRGGARGAPQSPARGR